MRIRDMNWMMVEDYLKRDDRAVIPDLDAIEDMVVKALAA